MLDEEELSLFGKEQIIERYHNSLADHLKLLSRDINDVYPKSIFYFELKDKIMRNKIMANVTEPAKALLSIETLVQAIAEKEGYKTFKLKITPISTQGANYLGDLYLVDIIEADKETLKLFAKANNIPKHARGFMPANRVYKREAFMYATVADIYHKLQERYEVPENKRFKFSKYYSSSLTDLEEVIILENLQAQGFVLHDRLKPINWEYAKAGVEEIAKLHALSFAFEKEDPKLFDTLIKNNNLLFNHDDHEAFAVAMNTTLHKSISVVDAENRPKIEKFFDENKCIFSDSYKTISKYSILGHGDYKLTNIIFECQETSVTSLKPVDYQTIYYGCPLNDLIYFIFTGTDEEFRRLHFEQIIEHYHNSLADHLKLLSRDINDIYPKSTFYFELKDKLLYGLFVAFAVLGGVLLEPSIVVKIEDFTDVAAMISHMANMSVDIKLYEERLNGIIRDFVRWGLLK